MAGRGVPELLRGELSFLQLGVGGHASRSIAAREFEHSMIERMGAGKRDELELVSHRPELTLELGNGRVVQMLFPVERG